ncbi:CLUMA_CG005270, isoform A [Clunio marinus]|uniref:CLUMA_CG005270, isoform A n=1 Tax=Clunio marinus TaxID=568069 RepID=A0A1J1HU66_9DIPT|nr:CLUMA_CG005270, isoform A [Clunio marinus]
MVLLTVCYMVSTGFQSWRLRLIYQKVHKVLDAKKSVVFLKTSDGSSAGITAALATSDLCVNSSEAVVGECFWSNDVSQGISVSPKQMIFMNPFVTFPQPPSYIPFKTTTDEAPGIYKDDVIYTLIEADLIQAPENQQSLEIETFGKLIAWKVDTRLAILLKTDSRKLSQMILSTFVQNNYAINDSLPLMRIQTVEIEGVPQDFGDIYNHSRKDHLTSQADVTTEEEWEIHLDGLRSLSRLASQATEYEQKKNLTEGKTGIVQPDLISSKTIEESLLNTVTSPDTPKKKLLSLEKTDEKIKGLKVELKRQEILKSPIAPNLPSFPEQNGSISDQKKIEATTPESPKFPTATPSKSPNASIKSKISNEPQSPKFPTGSPAKMPVFAEDKKPKVVKVQPKVEVEKKSPKPTIKNETKSLISAEKEASSVATANVVEPKKSEVKSKPINLPPITAVPPKVTAQEIAKNAPLIKPATTSQQKRQKLMLAKPPNILVYSDSVTTRDNVIKTLGTILEKHTYTIYPLNAQQVRNQIWLDNTTLLVVCGSVNGSDIGSIFLEYFFKGGKVLCLCSDLLGHVLPTYHTAEVREHELVQFSYGKWKNIKMMHHIFCYQPSPIKKNFSQESDEPPMERPSSASENPSVELKDQYGVGHNIRVQTLGTEDTWKTPSLLLIYTENGGKIIFSQIHLEVDPSLYENDEQKYKVLMSNDGLRHEIFGDVLSSHLDLKVNLNDENTPTFTKGYFLGRHELKFEVVEALKEKMETPNTLKLDGLTVKFCGKGEDPPTPDAHCLPIMMHTCPDDFSTLDYFDSLKTEHIGRLLVYSKILTSSSILVDKIKYCHGFAVIPKELTQASGRGSNKWLSPPGSLMFSLQLHIPLNSPLGQRVSLIQHMIATAVVMAIRKLPGYEVLELNLKWPNDIYANSEVKIGGLIVNSIMEQNIVVCNVGLAINLSNSTPTTSINDLIENYNKSHSRQLAALGFEKTLALIFNEIEDIFNHIQTGDFSYLYDQYYKFWLHSGSTIKVLSSDGKEKKANILGIDDYGFLKIQLEDSKEIESVQPDGNSFDMLRGLIIPKHK